MAQSAPTAIALKPAHDFRQAVFAVLDGVAREIKRFSAALHNKCPLVVFINQKGKTCSQFLKRSLFSGYYFQVTASTTIVINKETGAKYEVVLPKDRSIVYCTCASFKYSPLPKKHCKHLKMVADRGGHVEEQIEAIAPSFVGIDETDLPKGCSLHRTDDNLSKEYDLFVRVVRRLGGVFPINTTTCIGRLMEGMGGIQAFRLKSGIYRSFPTTMAAARYLVSSSDYTLTEIAKAFEQWDELALDF